MTPRGGGLAAGQRYFVDVEDIADVAAAALTQDGHSGEAYGQTGPRAIN